MVADGEKLVEGHSAVDIQDQFNHPRKERRHPYVFFLSLLVPCNKYEFLYLNTLKMIQLEFIPDSLVIANTSNQKTTYRDHPPRKYFYQSSLLYSQVPTV